MNDFQGKCRSERMQLSFKNLDNFWQTTLVIGLHFFKDKGISQAIGSFYQSLTMMPIIDIS